MSTIRFSGSDWYVTCRVKNTPVTSPVVAFDADMRPMTSINGGPVQPLHPVTTMVLWSPRQLYNGEEMTLLKAEAMLRKKVDHD